MDSLGEVLKRHPANGSRSSTTQSSVAGPELPPNQSDVCELCLGIGWLRKELPVEHPEFGGLLPCECLQLKFDLGKSQRLTRFSNLGPLSTVNFDDLSANRQGRDTQPGLQQAITTSITYAGGPTGWLGIVGPSGSGKTRLAAAIANERINAGFPVLFIPVADLLDHLRSTYAPGTDVSYDELFEQVRSVGLLILDDLGQESSTSWAKEKLSQILSHRYNNRSPTVITTCSLNDLDDRIITRMLDKEISQIITLHRSSPTLNGAIDRLHISPPTMTFETFRQDGSGLRGQLRDNLNGAMNLAKEFAESPDGWVVFIGKNGSGKTHLASAIGHRAQDNGHDVLMLLVPQFLDFLRSTFGHDGRTAYEALERVEHAEVLILDDFGEAIGTSWTRERLDVILNYRSLNRLPTVITSSLSPDDMEPRFWSRMSDLRLSVVYEIMAPDFRTGRDYPVNDARKRSQTKSSRPRSR